VVSKSEMEGGSELRDGRYRLLQTPQSFCRELTLYWAGGQTLFSSRISHLDKGVRQGRLRLAGEGETARTGAVRKYMSSFKTYVLAASPSYLDQ